ncbi:DUF5655 domain-containing protein [Arthrobacter sp. CC3]|jgi:hypothetical protein|uniref:DUF5655 domain-containing protein n=1 Tax=Arthrobacter sp. CC3 TaxID=3029185 RepID=UPI0032635D49
MTRGAAGKSTPEEVFRGSPLGLELLRRVEGILAAYPPSTMNATKSQVAFRGRRGFAYLWWPARYIRSDVPAVLSIALPRRIDSARFKEVVSPAPGVWMHHLELRFLSDLDDEVAEWLGEARREAG